MNVVISILSEPSIILGVVAFAGLMLQKGPSTKVFEGTSKTVVGFLISNLGDSTVTGVLRSFNTPFQVGFHINRVVAMSRAAVTLAKESYRCVVSVTFIVAFVVNLLFAGFTRFKNIVFLINIQFMFDTMLALVIKSHGYSDTAVILVGGISIGLASAFLPELCQPSVWKVTGSNDMVVSHFSTCAYALSGYVGKLLSKYENEPTEDLKLSGQLSFFKGFTPGMSMIMLILSYITSFATGQQTTQKMAGSVHRIVWLFIQAVTFTAGMNILVYGVRMFLAEVTAASISISEEIIPNARPALDYLTLFPYASASVILGSLSTYIASLMVVSIMASTNAPAVFIPATNVRFFLGEAAEVFGNSTGGWRGTIASSFVTGLLLSSLPLVMYPILAGMGVAQPTFLTMDYNAISTIIYRILTLVRKIF